MLWVKNYDYDTQQQFIDLVFQPFWKRDLDVESSAVIQHLLDRVGANGKAFCEWARAEGAAMNAQLQSAAFSAGS